MTALQDEVKSPSVLPATLALFTSATTLICCALPAMLVMLGMGAVWSGVIGTVPGITWFGANKGLVFAVTGLVLAASGAWQWHARTLPCPADPVKARACTRLRRISWTLWGISVAAFCVGGFFAFFPGLAEALFL
ncbi:MAG: hypothetical protein NXH70_03620 [Hyphomonas sp.]|jgi:hypothetical protein|nr:hypothetical protein [Henriciella sp.]MBO6695088.1 hypothetical protein [Henriciella sp.]MCH9750838.1 hypothetical protein [Alphaproteobacteria bacterium]MCR9223137.1 hypothetical protein [Hyphomonas sp.]